MLSSNKNVNNEIINEQLASKIDELDKKIKSLKELKEMLEYYKDNLNLAECNLLKILYKTS